MAVPLQSHARIRAEKSDLRVQASSLRAQTPFNRDHCDALLSNLRKLLEGFPGAVIGGVWPLENEIDLRPLLQDLSFQGWRIALPETTPKGSPLLFRAWCRDTPLQKGRFDTFHPAGAETQPDVLLVPMLAFDSAFYRLGYGGGYYDRTLAQRRKHAVGFAYAWQKVDVVPRDDFDVPMDVIVTERSIQSRI